MNTRPTAWRQCSHPRTPENTSGRSCRSCKREQQAARRARRSPNGAKRRPYIMAMTPVQLAEALAAFNRVMSLPTPPEPQ